jgi:replicative DNA helicase
MADDPDGIPSWCAPDYPAASQPRILPTSYEAERALLGALMSNNKSLDRLAFLRPEHFADPTNGRVFSEVIRVVGENGIADAVTLKAAFDEAGALKGVGGTAYLTALMMATVAPGLAVDYGRVVRDTWLRRELIGVGESLVTDAYSREDSADPIALALRAAARLDGLASAQSSSDTTSLNCAVDAALEAMEVADGKPAGLSTGFATIDARLGGLEPGLVYTLAGRPGSGKSSLGHQIALNVAGQGVGVLELSLEMSSTQLGRRALSAASMVPLWLLKGGKVDDRDRDALYHARGILRDRPLLIDDAGGQTPRQIAAKCRAAKRRNGGLGLVMLDHLNLTRPDDGDAKHGPTFAIERAAGMMLQIAKECEVAVLMLTQLNRGVEGRDDKRPCLSDLRQSGAIEENSYAVGFLYRQEYYLQNEPERKEAESDDKYDKRYKDWVSLRNKVAGKAELLWAKVRDGQPGTDLLRFHGKTTSFSESGEREWS